jgi:rhomboid protease GluP
MARIPARSRRQALDWSLVLLSQGIEHMVERPASNGSWELLVSAADLEGANEAIDLYRRENRGRPWRRELFSAGLLFDWASLAWGLLLCVFYWLSETQPGLRAIGEMDAMDFSHGEWWRAFTAMWLHADLSHLASNGILGFILLGLAMARYGTGIGLLAGYLSGAGGNVIAWLFTTQSRISLGASGMVMGCLGLLAIQSLALWRHAPAARRYLVSGVMGGIMLFLILGVAPGTDWLAHGGGFASGLLFGGILTQVPRLTNRPWLNVLGGFLFTTLVIWPWWAAVKQVS